MKNLFKNGLVFLLTLEARAVVRRYRPNIIAVTGSVGKTSTKDAIYALLEGREHVRKSEKSFNSEIGLPLTILGMPNGWHNPVRWIENIIDGLFLLLVRSNYPAWLVLEVGADRPGDIQRVSKWLPVEVAVITRLPEVPVHVEFFASPEEVVNEKAALIDALKPRGTLVLYGDDARAEEFRARLARASAAAGMAERRVVTFGLSRECDVYAEEGAVLFDEHVPVGMRATVVAGESRVPLEVRGAVGMHMLLPALAAAAVGVALDIEPSVIAEALKRYEPPVGRMHLIAGIKDTILIDDTYNSSPAAVVAALDALVHIAGAPNSARTGRRIAVLGDMLELGRHSVEEHRKVGLHAAATAELLVTVGFRARDIAQGALDAGMAEQNILQFEDPAEAGEELAAIISKGDCVLIKGSQSMRMERTVKQLMLEPENAPELLVRQDEEWERR